MKENYELDYLLTKTKKQLINIGGYRNAKHMLKDKVFTVRGVEYLPSRKKLAKAIYLANKE